MQTEKLGDLIMDISKNLKTIIERKLRHNDIGMGQMQILMSFFSHSEFILTQNELVNMIQVDKGNISRSLTKLIEKDYLVKSNDRTKGYQLSAKGIALKSEIILILININTTITKDIDLNDINQTIRTLTNISRNIKEIV